MHVKKAEVLRSIQPLEQEMLARHARELLKCGDIARLSTLLHPLARLHRPDGHVAVGLEEVMEELVRYSEATRQFPDIVNVVVVEPFVLLELAASDGEVPGWDRVPGRDYATMEIRDGLVVSWLEDHA